MSDNMTVVEWVGDEQPVAETATGWVAEEFLRLGDEYYSVGQYEDAARKYRLALRSDPENRRAATGYNRAVRRCVPTLALRNAARRVSRDPVRQGDHPGGVARISGA